MKTRFSDEQIISILREAEAGVSAPNSPVALDLCAFEHGVELRLIQPGKLTQNGFIKSFNGRFRDEFLNENWFNARKIINDWRQDYNDSRPHSSLKYQTPSEFAAGWRNGKKRKINRQLLTEGCI